MVNGKCLNIKRFVANAIGENCYILWDDTLEAAIIDCGAWGETKKARIAQFIEENALRPCMALQTHMHFDHVLGLPFLYRCYGLRPRCHAFEQEVYNCVPTMASELFGLELSEPPVPVGEYLADDEELQFGNTRFRTLFTPGHTPGGLCFYFPLAGALFSGDTLFPGSIGRSDLPGGNHAQLLHSIHTRLLTLPDDVTVYPGHGPATTVGDERRNNPFLQTEGDD